MLRGPARPVRATPSQEAQMAAHTLRDVLRLGLGEIYDAEQQVLAVLDEMETETESDEVRDRIRRHRDETRHQLENIERCIELLGAGAPRVRSGALRGIREARPHFRQEASPSGAVLEIFNLDTIGKIEGMEIAAYRTLIAQARALGDDDIRRLLEQNLRQEEEMARWSEEGHLRMLDRLLVKR